MSAPEFVHRYVPPRRGTFRGGAPRTLLLLPGAGGDENELLSLAAEIAPGAGLLAPRGNAGREGRPAFFRAPLPEPLGTDERRRRAVELADFVRAAAAQYGFDPLDVLALGLSNGASVAASVLTERPETLAGGALLHATAPPTPGEPPSLHGKRVFLVAGENDPAVSVEETTRLHTMLHRYGADVQTAWFPGDPIPTAAKIRALAAWIRAL